MAGYGRIPPDPRWPGGARIALQIVVNYEEGGENCLLHGDPASEAFLSEIVGAEAWPGQRHWNMESLYEYGSRSGFWRLHRILTERQLPVTVFGVATALARSPEQVAAMQEADWEIASHGLKWIDYRHSSEEQERADLQAAIALHREVTGERPLGWYLGRCSMNTTRLVAEEGGFDYTADSYADELPYWDDSHGRPQLVVPYTLDANDMRFATPQGFNSGAQFETYLRDSFDTLYQEGVAGMPRMMSIGLHCRLAGRPGRSAALANFLDYALAQDGVWTADRLDIAYHWQSEHPYQPRERPSRMDRDRFVETFGGVFEHSPWVAERAHASELGAANDTATGLLAAMVRVFRAAGEDERRGVIAAHPDLAGKLAAARRLTGSSTAEQASAGLDALTDAEREAFTRLNNAYRDKFGFPFIIAVRDHTKAGILERFDLRLGNDPDSEFAEACRQVERIACLRLGALLP